MKPLISIETIPIKIEYVKKEPLLLSSVHGSKTKKSNENRLHRVQNNPIRISLSDSYKPSTDYQWDNATYTATAKYGDDGMLKLNVQMEDGEAKPIRFKEITRGIDQMAGLLDGSEGDSADMELSLDMGVVPSGIGSGNNQDIEFLPPDIELKITQWPKVIIKYVGGPIYTPASADPHYVKPEATKQNLSNGLKTSADPNDVKPEGLMKTSELTQGVKLNLKI